MFLLSSYNLFHYVVKYLLESFKITETKTLLHFFCERKMSADVFRERKMSAEVFRERWQERRSRYKK